MNKRNYFDIKDASSGSLLFVILQTVFIGALSGAVIMGFSYSSTVGYILTAFLEATFGLTVVIVCSMYNVKFFNATKLNVKVNFKQIILSIILCFVCLYGFSGITNCFYYFIRLIGYSSPEIVLEASTFGSFLLQVLCICIVPAFFEEVLFRGLICNGLSKIGKWPAIIISAALFSLMHGNPDQTIFQFGLGIVLAYAFMKSGSLWVPMIIHFSNNFFVSLLSYINSVRGVESTAEEAMITYPELISSLYSAVTIVLIAVVIIWIICRYIKNPKTTLISEDSVQRTQASVDGQVVEAVVENNTLNSVPLRNEKGKFSKTQLSLLIISFIWLAIDWVYAFINGFGA